MIGVMEEFKTVLAIPGKENNICHAGAVRLPGSAHGMCETTEFAPAPFFSVCI